jgi:hypothetical protein
LRCDFDRRRRRRFPSRHDHRKAGFGKQFEAGLQPFKLPAELLARLQRVRVEGIGALEHRQLQPGTEMRA